MSFDNLNIGKRVENYEVSQIFDAYSRVDVTMGEDAEGNVITVSYPVPTETDDYSSGRILTVDMPMCTDTTLASRAAKRIYESLTSENVTAFQYQPMQADGALADPAMEFGDSVDINNVHSGFYTRSIAFGRLMKTNLSAPADEEIDHEYPYQDAQERQIKRIEKNYRASFTVLGNRIEASVTELQNADSVLSTRITQTSSAITTEVSDRKAAVNGLRTELNSSIEQTATNIRADVVAKTDGTKKSFGWNLTADSWEVYANNNTVLKATKSGLEVSGKITATSGEIGGFAIGENAIYNGKTSRDEVDNNGIYLGTDGIALGKGKFVVTNAGKLTATSGTIGGFTIGNTALYSNSKNGINVDVDGVFIGTGGIALGKKNVFKVTNTGAVTAAGGNFKITSDGTVTAKNMKLTGTLTVGSATITADNLRKGANYAIDGHTSWDSAYDWAYTPSPSYGGVSAGSYAISGAAGGYDWNDTQSFKNTKWPYLYLSGLSASGNLNCDGNVITNGLSMKYNGFPRSCYLGSIKDGDGETQYVVCWS